MTCTLSCSGRSFCPVWRRHLSAVGQSLKRCTKATGSGVDQGSQKRKEHIFIIFFTDLKPIQQLWRYLKRKRWNLCSKTTETDSGNISQILLTHVRPIKVLIRAKHNLSFTFIFVNSKLPFVVNALTWDHSHSQRSNSAAGPADGSSYNNLSWLWAGFENVQLWGCCGDIPHDALQFSLLSLIEMVW